MSGASYFVADPNFNQWAPSNDPNQASGFIVMSGDTFRIASSRTPSSSTDTGFAGEIAWDTSYLYVCIDTDTWTRVALGWS